MSGSDSNQCEGYSNYATFGVAVTLDNERETFDALREQAEIERASVKSDGNFIAGIWTEEQTALYRFADWMKDYTERLCESGKDQSLIASQMIQAGLAEVNWEELAASILGENS